MKRRRFLSLVSAACLVPATAARAYRWQGAALGAKAQIILDHPDAKTIARAARAEIERLENIFSLYRAESELMRLNRAGRLSAPSFELLECLGLAGRVYRASGGAFDPTVQPLWRVLAEAQGGTADATRLASARAAIGFERIRADAAELRLGVGQELTLNGIAQGYIADRVAALMARQGVGDVLIDTGEIVARGASPEGGGWPVRLAGEAAPRRWSNRAIASSATLGTVLDPSGKLGHILATDGHRRAPRETSVSAKSAALADALSTAACLARSEGAAKRMIAPFEGAKLERFAEV